MTTSATVAVRGDGKSCFGGNVRMILDQAVAAVRAGVAAVSVQRTMHPAVPSKPVSVRSYAPRVETEDTGGGQQQHARLAQLEKENAELRRALRMVSAMADTATRWPTDTPTEECRALST